MLRDQERELELLRLALSDARDAEEIAAVFDDLVQRVGTADASHLWWAVFGETDAPRTG